MIWFLFLYDGPRTPDCLWFQQGLGGGLARMAARPQLHGPPSVQDSCSLSYGQDGLGELSSSPSFITRCVERRLEPPFSG